jgi:hypothetical protein
MLFSLQNLSDTVVAEAREMGEDDDMPQFVKDFKWTSQTPIAMGMTTEETMARVVWFVPTALVKDSVTWGMKMEEHQAEQRRKWREEAEARRRAMEAGNDDAPANDF